MLFICLELLPALIQCFELKYGSILLINEAIAFGDSVDVHATTANTSPMHRIKRNKSRVKLPANHLGAQLQSNDKIVFLLEASFVDGHSNAVIYLLLQAEN